MQRVENEIERLINECDYEEVKELFNKLSGGKRLRAKLILKIADQHKDAPLLAAIVELIHAASLLHDDIIDESMTRRGVESVIATEGSKIAVMLGDILYSKAFTELVAFVSSIAETIASSVVALSKGEMMDVKMSESFNSDEKLYLDMLYLKTATLIESATKSAALLVGKDAESYALYGRNLGISFQIIDDILDITSTEEKLGKPAMNDYVEGKCTLPYIYLYEALDREDRVRLVAAHAQHISKKESAWIEAKMKEFGVIEKSFMLAKKLSTEAKNRMSEDPSLLLILDTMIQRSY